MPRSPHFIRIKGQVLELTRAIPPGRVTAFRGPAPVGPPPGRRGR